MNKFETPEESENDVEQGGADLEHAYRGATRIVPQQAEVVLPDPGDEMFSEGAPVPPEPEDRLRPAA